MSELDGIKTALPALIASRRGGDPAQAWADADEAVSTSDSPEDAFTRVVWALNAADGRGPTQPAEPTGVE